MVLSSHLLDEVERTCDAVAIVDHGKVIRQGPIADLLAGSAFELQIDCSTPDRAGTLLAGTRGERASTSARTACGSTWPPAPNGRWWPRSTGSWSRAAISVYRLQEIHASLESWFLEVTTRLGEPE